MEDFIKNMTKEFEKFDGRLLGGIEDIIDNFASQIC